MSNFHSLHSRQRIVQDNKNSITARITMEAWSRPDTFTFHPTSTTDVTWGIEYHNHRMMNIDLAFEWRAHISS